MNNEKMDSNKTNTENIERGSEDSYIGGDHVAVRTDTFAIDEDALGKNLPKNYYRSIGFIGTVIVNISPAGILEIWLTYAGIMSREH
jgi:hypothetical protein